MVLKSLVKITRIIMEKKKVGSVVNQALQASIKFL